MVFRAVFWIELLLLLIIAPRQNWSKYVDSGAIQDALDLPQEDSRIKKRSLQSGNKGSDITMNFQHGMRDLIVNSKTNDLQVLPIFQATLTSGDIGPNYAHDAIKFNDVAINIGNGYNPSTGKFTAPVKGVYEINFSYLQKNGYRSHVQLMKDGVVYTELHAYHKSYDQLSKTVLIKLKKGQKVWVRLVKSSGYAVYGGNRYTTFSGHLISY